MTDLNCRRFRKSRGFSLVELLLALFFLSTVVLGIIWLNSSSSRSSMDAYYEFLALQLALEPIEVFRAFGYNCVVKFFDNPLPDYPINAWHDIKPGKFLRPGESGMFERLISLKKESDRPGIFRIRVEIRPKGQTRVRTWLLRQVFSMESLIVERPR